MSGAARARPPRPNLELVSGPPRDMAVIHALAHKLRCSLHECGTGPDEWCPVRRAGRYHHLERYYDLRDSRLISYAEFAAVLALPHSPYANSFALIAVEP